MAHDKQSKDMQENVIRAIRTIVGAEMQSMNATKSTIGIVLDNPKNYKAKVKINDDVFEAIVPEHVHHWIQKDDVVVIRDLYNDKKKLVIEGKTGHISGEPQLVFSDARDTDKYVSGVDGVFDENGNLLNYATVDSSAYGASNLSAEPLSSNEIVIEFASKSTEWNIEHNSPKAYPSIVLVNSNNELIQGNITYVNGSSVKVVFSEPVSGKAILS